MANVERLKILKKMHEVYARNTIVFDDGEWHRFEPKEYHNAMVDFYTAKINNV